MLRSVLFVGRGGWSVSDSGGGGKGGVWVGRGGRGGKTYEFLGDVSLA